MNHELLKPQEYLSLREKGIDISSCMIDFKLVSVTCSNLSLYRKALRVKIRTLIKLDDKENLRTCIKTLYSLACFVKSLYGHHSCMSDVEPGQELLALRLQMNFEIDDISMYSGSNWLTYLDVDCLDKLKVKYKDIFHAQMSDGQWIQDKKPFLSLKDKSHFDACLIK